MKRCSKCKELKESSEFYKQKTGYLSSRCKKCACECSRIWANTHKKHRAKMERNRRRKNPKINQLVALKRFDLTLEQYKKANEFFNGKCCICGKPETSKRNGKLKRLAVDHDHKTGHLRGLLCSKCNMLIGLANDNIQILENAIKHLKFGRINGAAFVA